MNKFYLSVCLLLISYLAQAMPQTPELRASVDRQRLYQGESLELTLLLSPANDLQEPDIQPLKQDFNLLSSRQNFQQHNGVQQRRWVFRLSPKHQGVQQIPAVQLGQLSSQPIALQLLAQPQPEQQADSRFFLHTSLSKSRVYLHEQSILRLRIYHASPFVSGTQLQHLSMPQARVEQLGQPRTSEQIINQQRYGVIEVSYAIYPLQTGTMQIPSLEFNATPIKDGPALHQAGIIEPDRPLQLSSTPLPLEVLPPPAEFPANAHWLPVAKLQLEQSWTPANGIGSSEQAIQRQLELRVDGLPASLLPNLLPEHQQHFQLYTNPVSRRETSNAGGISSQQTESQALVANEAGNYLIPEQSLPWWDTTNNRLAYASLPEQILRIHNPASTQIFHEPDSEQHYWQLLSFFLALGNLLFFTLWRMGRQQSDKSHNNHSNNRLLENLRRACKNHNPQQARSAIDALARQASITPSEAARLSPEFALALTELNTVLYTNNQAQTWLGDNLWNAVSKLRTFNQQQNSDSLPPLYPP